MADQESTTARELWQRFATMPQDNLWAYLETHQLHVDGEWRTFNQASIERARNTPLLLHTDFPDGEYRVPMDADILIRTTS